MRFVDLRAPEQQVSARTGLIATGMTNRRA
jgi:hypothetical protein